MQRGLGFCLIALWSWIPAPQARWSWSGVERIVAVGDIHGDYERYIQVLRSAQIINRMTDWSGGRTHLVQMGDIPDRGPYPRKIMDLLMKLEEQAEKAGGRVHVVLGNHEAMNVYGDLRYVTPEEYEEFRDSNSEQVRQAFWGRALEEMYKNAEAGGTTAAIDSAFRRRWRANYPLGFFEHRSAYAPNGKYGRWILNHNAIIRIDDTLFVHGGIGPKYADVAPDVINQKVRSELADFSLLQGGIITDEEGPLWYRGLAQGDELELAAHVDAVLTNFGVRRIVIGHTPTGTTVIPRFGGEVILADVGLSRVYGGPPACLVIEKNIAYALHRGKLLEIPRDSGKELLAYLRRAAALDPRRSPIDKAIQELQTKLAAAPVKP